MDKKKRKRLKLGMDPGTARSALIKKLLFLFAQRLKKDDCFVCHKKIKSVSDFTIEHKKSWLYSKDSKKAFFDESNIAFSHAVCNRPQYPNEGAKKEHPNKNMSWCCKCQRFKKRDDFHKNATRWTGLNSYCRKCQKEHDYKRRHK